jgi:excisionase family DNA binding protein
MERLTTPEVAARLGCSQGHVRQLALDGKLKVERISPRIMLFDAADVAAFAALTFTQGWKRGRSRKPAPDATPPAADRPK